MKKPSFDQDKVKAFFAQNVEKIVLGLVVLIAMVLTYSAVNQETYSRNPLELKDKADSADRHLSEQNPERFGEHIAQKLVNTSWDKGTRQFKTEDYQRVATDTLTRPVRPEDFKTKPFNPPLFPQGLRRGEPNFLPAAELHVVAVTGAIGVKGGEGDSDSGGTTIRGRDSSDTIPAGTIAQGMNVAVVTAYVPFDDQQAAYNRAFEEARFQPEERSSPKYAGFEIEVSVDGGPWEAVNLVEANKHRKTWIRETYGIVPQSWIDPQLTWPLPPLLGDRWTRDVVAHPRVQFAAGSEPAEEPATDVPSRQPPSEGVPSVLPPSALSGAPSEPASRPSRALPDRRDRRDGPPSAEGEAPPATGRLFRFFDFAVQPDRDYRYRVKLWLHNPNYQIATRYLEKADYSKGRYRTSEWSEPSSSVRMREGLNLFAGSVDGRDETATIVIKKFRMDLGRNLIKEFSDVARGQLANQDRADCGGIDPLSGRPRVVRDIELVTDYLLVDLRGGHKIGKGDSSFTEPGEILLLDNDGRLIVRNELEDEPAYNSAMQQFPGASQDDESDSGKQDDDRPGFDPLGGGGDFDPLGGK